MSAFDPLPRVVLMPGLGALCAGPRPRRVDHRPRHHRADARREGARGGVRRRTKAWARPTCSRWSTGRLQHAKLDGPRRRGPGRRSGARHRRRRGDRLGRVPRTARTGCLVAATDLPGAAARRPRVGAGGDVRPGDHRRAARRDRRRVGRGGVRGRRGHLGRRGPRHRQRRHRARRVARPDGSRGVPQARAGQHRRHAAGPGRERAPLQGAGHRRRRRARLDQERVRARREVRRLQRDEGGGAPAWPGSPASRWPTLDVRVNMVSPDAVFSRRRAQVRTLGGGRARPDARARPRRGGARGVLPEPEPAEGAASPRSTWRTRSCSSRPARRRPPARRSRSTAACRTRHRGRRRGRAQSRAAHATSRQHRPHRHDPRGAQGARARARGRRDPGRTGRGAGASPCTCAATGGTSRSATSSCCARSCRPSSTSRWRRRPR